MESLPVMISGGFPIPALALFFPFIIILVLTRKTLLKTTGLLSQRERCQNHHLELA